MPTRRRVLAAGVALAGAAAGCSSDGTEDQTVTQTSRTDGGGTGLSLKSPAFDDGASIPVRYTCEGAGESPPLNVAGVPDGAASLALVVDDPDAPGGTYVHWVVWNVPPDAARVPGDVPQGETVSALDGARQGKNSAGGVGYAPPCPPTGDGAHTYRFTLTALDGILDLSAGAARDGLADAASGHELARTTLRGTFER